MDSLALSNDYTTLLKEAERLRADLSSKIIERDIKTDGRRKAPVRYYQLKGNYRPLGQNHHSGLS